MAEPDPLLEVRDLTVKYGTSEGPVTGVSNASFTVEPEEFFGLIGESGCGKSTLAKSIIGGLDPNGSIESGTIRYKGEEIQDFSDEEFSKRLRWNEISYIPQASMNSLDPIERIDAQAIRIGRAHTDQTKAELQDRLRSLFNVMGLPEYRMSDYPHQFSGGMKQRAIIALSLLLEPSLLIADEPTTALDVIMQDKIFKYITNIKDEFETSLLLITHDISVTFELCRRMSIMHAGQICEIGTAETVFDDPRHPYTAALQHSFPDIRFPDAELGTIEGHPPTLRGESPGTYCHYVDRCPLSTEECEAHAPPLEPFEGSPDHLVACIHADETPSITDEFASRTGDSSAAFPGETND